MTEFKNVSWIFPETGETTVLQRNLSLLPFVFPWLYDYINFWHWKFFTDIFASMADFFFIFIFKCFFCTVKQTQKNSSLTHVPLHNLQDCAKLDAICLCVGLIMCLYVRVYICCGSLISSALLFLRTQWASGHSGACVQSTCQPLQSGLLPVGQW